MNMLPTKKICFAILRESCDRTWSSSNFVIYDDSVSVKCAQD